MVAPAGTPVLSTADGTILEIGRDPVYGIFVIIDHSGGYESVYAHLQRTLVKKGQQVSSGDPVGLVGNTGGTTGAHLHFEIHYNGKPRDPLQFIKK
jgi:murein DD-endopeptidase MepM/ murein hydrolase activator NlpD